jgi:hypothetical protein
MRAPSKPKLGAISMLVRKAGAWWSKWSKRRAHRALRKLRKSQPFHSSSFIDSDFLPTATPACRAVPIRVKDLSEVLDRNPGSRESLRYLHVVEQTLQTVNRDALSYVSPWVIKQAIRQLESLGDGGHQRGVRMLSLQMRRKSIEHEARKQAAAAGAFAWAEEWPMGAGRARGRDASTNGFAKTRVFERVEPVGLEGKDGESGQLQEAACRQR